MLRFRIVRYLAVLFPFILTLASPMWEPLKGYLFNPYELRWYSPDIATDRVQQVSVYNGGSAELPKVMVELNVQSNSVGPVSDFYFHALDSSPRVSFLETLASANSTSSLLTRDTNKILPILDSHSANRNLFTLDRELDNALISELEKKPFAKVLAEFQRNTSDCAVWHEGWLKECLNSTDAICDQVNSVLGNWEHARRGLQGEAETKWQNATGVTALLPGDKLSPVGKIFFIFPLRAKESSALGIKYGLNPVKSAEIIVSSSMANKAVRVETPGDLRASPVWIFAKKHRLLSICLTLAFVFSVWVAWEAAKPNKLRPIERIFNLALRTNDHEFWDLANQRHRYFILQEYRRLRQTIGEYGLPPDPNEVLDFVRERLTKQHERDKAEYDNRDKLDSFITNQLSLFVLPVQQIFNLALRRNDNDSWEIAYQRYRYFIHQEFDKFREIFGKDNLKLDDDKVSVFVKESLIMENKRRKAENKTLHRAEYKTVEELNKFVHNQLRFFVLYS